MYNGSQTRSLPLDMPRPFGLFAVVTCSLIRLTVARRLLLMPSVCAKGGDDTCQKPEPRTAQHQSSDNERDLVLITYPKMNLGEADIEIKGGLAVEKGT